MSIINMHQIWKETIEKYSLENKNTLFIEEIIKPTKFFKIINNDFIVLVDKNENLELVNINKNRLQNILNELIKKKFNLIFINHSQIDNYLTAELNINTNLNSSMTFDNYVLGDFNKNAHKLMNYILVNGFSIFNPIFIYSKTGLGKTHLLMATANEFIPKFPNKKVIYLESQTFIREIFKSFEEDKNSHLIEAIKDKYENCDMLIIDDIQYLAEKNKTNEILFTIFNTLINNKKIIIMTSDRPPQELNGFESRMISRFSSGITCKIDEPEISAIEKIIENILLKQNIKLTPIALEMLSNFCDKDIRKLLGLLNKIIFFSSLNEENRELNENNVKTILEVDGQILGPNKRMYFANPSKIIEIISKIYNLKVVDVIGNSRKKNIAMCRHVIMYIMREHAKMPLKDIGNFLGNRDHATVLNGIEKIKTLKMNDKEFSGLLSSIIKKVIY